jgi:probable selenium-dependent hydroxylase accessory protein YqeC
MDLFGAVDARSGVVCVVGAGGKKTALYTLAARAAREGRRSVVTATVRIPIFDEHVARVHTTTDPVDTLRTGGDGTLEESEEWPVGVVPEREGNRYRGYDTAVIDDLARSGVADVVLVKADGARTREFKAPGDREPQLPESTDTVLPIASVHAVGKPLTEEHVHRPERVATITGLSEGEEITPADVATVLASSEGGLKGVPDGATAIPVLNKVDDEKLAGVGREIAREVLDCADVPRVVLTRLVADDPVVDVVE